MSTLTRSTIRKRCFASANVLFNVDTLGNARSGYVDSEPERRMNNTLDNAKVDFFCGGRKTGENGQKPSESD